MEAGGKFSAEHERLLTVDCPGFDTTTMDLDCDTSAQEPTRTRRGERGGSVKFAPQVENIEDEEQEVFLPDINSNNQSHGSGSRKDPTGDTMDLCVAHDEEEDQLSGSSEVIPLAHLNPLFQSKNVDHEKGNNPHSPGMCLTDAPRRLDRNAAGIETDTHENNGAAMDLLDKDMLKSTAAPFSRSKRNTIAYGNKPFAASGESLHPLHDGRGVARRGSVPVGGSGTKGRLDSHQTHTKRPSKFFTVINYGHVGSEASVTKATGHEPCSLVEIADVPEVEDETGKVEDVTGKVDHSLDAFLRQLSNESYGAHSVVSLTSSTARGHVKRSVSVQPIEPPKLPEVVINVDDIPDGPQVMVDASQEPSVQEKSSFLSQCRIDGSKITLDRDIKEIIHLGQMFTQRKRDRLVGKDGAINIHSANISKRHFLFLRDIFTTLLDLSWRWVWMLFIVAFILSWLCFGVVWWLVCFANGDFAPKTPNHQRCVTDIDDFASALLFSIETQHTIGYGSRAVTKACPASFLALIAQSLLGVVIQCVMAGVVFAKLARPKSRAETVLFSKNASICFEDGQYCLVFRVGDMRRSQLVGCVLHAFLVRNHVTAEGRVLPFRRYRLQVLPEGEDHDQNLFLAWPTLIIHRITSDSPLWGVSRENLITEHFEIIVVLEGTIESSGMTTQIRTSYLPSEIEWGQRFLSLLTKQKSSNHVKIDYSNFNETETLQSMPNCSPKEYAAQIAIDQNSILPSEKRNSTHSRFSAPYLH